jgi:predicted transcriptional regulator
MKAFLTETSRFPLLPYALLTGMLALCLAAPAAVPSPLVGREAPYFRVESGDGRVLDTGMLRGKVVVMFYEARDCLAKSRPLKKALNAFYNEQRKEEQELILRVPVINCTAAVWPFRGIWKRELVQNSKRVGMTVYGDWDGEMRTSFGMKGDDTNLVILDKKGRVRYFHTGVIAGDGEGVNVLKKLLKALVAEHHEKEIPAKKS